MPFLGRFSPGIPSSEAGAQTQARVGVVVRGILPWAGYVTLGQVKRGAIRL